MNVKRRACISVCVRNMVNSIMNSKSTLNVLVYILIIFIFIESSMHYLCHQSLFQCFMKWPVFFRNY